MRTCTRCGLSQSLDRFYVSRVTGRPDPVTSTWCKSCHIEGSAERAKRRWATPEGREKARGYALRSARRTAMRRQGVPEDQIDALVQEAGNGCCHACGRRPSELSIPNKSAARLHADHDHVTGLHRGLLCQHCNSALGLVQDDPDRLLALAAYLLRNRDVLQDIAMLGAMT